VQAFRSQSTAADAPLYSHHSSIILNSMFSMCVPAQASVHHIGRRVDGQREGHRRGADDNYVVLAYVVSSYGGHSLLAWGNVHNLPSIVAASDREFRCAKHQERGQV
jgi:hypothetical protein